MHAALCGALSKRVAKGDVVVLDDLAFAAPRTREFVALLERFELTDALFVLGGRNENVELSARNLPGVCVLPPIGVNVYDVLRRSKLVLTRAAVDELAKRLGGE
jgi:large subunit ribosomal protein L4